ALRGLDDGRHDARLRDNTAHRAHGAAAGSLRDLADLELQLRRTGESVATLVHRRRAGMRGLPPERDEVPLDAERAEDDAERQIHRLEHRPLLDVQLEVRRSLLELR